MRRTFSLQRSNGRRRGQNLVEFAGAITLVILVTASILQYALVARAINTVKYVTRKCARYAAIHATDNTAGLQSDAGLNSQFSTYATEAGESTSDISFTITPAANATTRQTSNPITITAVYNMKSRLFLGNFPGMKGLQSYTYSSTATIE